MQQYVLQFSLVHCSWLKVKDQQIKGEISLMENQCEQAAATAK